LRRKAFFYISVSLFSLACFAGEPDKGRYIGIDEIQAGMKGYCLSCFKGTEVEKFDLEVISTVKNMQPGRDAIIVKSTDERFIHAGLIGGVSGSPVYIQGRLAGAMSFGWPDSKDPIYGVTPIKDMISVGQESNLQSDEAKYTSVFDYSKPLNLLDLPLRFSTQVEAAGLNKSVQSRVEQKRSSSSAMPVLPCAIITAGLPESAVRELKEIFESRGLVTVAASGGGCSVITEANFAQSQDKKASRLVAGSPLIIPMVTGDMVAAVVGTVTEVVGDNVYGFGHSFLGYGPVDLPISAQKSGRGRACSRHCHRPSPW
jgi:hypothetical protein